MTGRRDLALLGLAAALVALPLALTLPGDYEGSDGKAARAIAEMHPGYRQWIEPLWTPPSKDIESLLFALQAAVGAGVLGFVLGRRWRR